MRPVYVIGLAALAVALIATRKGRGVEEQGDNMPDQTAGVFEDWWNTFMDQINSEPVPSGRARANERAFLDMIAYAEGTSGNNGYRMLYNDGPGGQPAYFLSYADHPRLRMQFKDLTGKVMYTTAAGRYQFLARTWDELRAKLSLKDFGPASQDRAALELIRQRGALADVRAGRVAVAVAKVAPIWASMPGAGYSQPERKLASLTAAYQSAGGTMEA